MCEVWATSVELGRWRQNNRFPFEDNSFIHTAMARLGDPPIGVVDGRCKHLNIAVRHDSREMALHANLNVFDYDGTAGHVVQHWPILRFTRFHSLDTPDAAMQKERICPFVV